MSFRLARQLLDRLVRLRGYTVADLGNLDGVAALVFLQALWNELQPDLVVDVGANVGQFRSVVRDELGYRGVGLSFEPVPRYFRYLAAVCKDDHLWDARPLALGSSICKAGMNVMGEFSSLLEPTSVNTRIFERANKPSEIIEVDVSTVDNEVPDGSERIFLKLDTQGNELQVLSGACQVLNRVVALQAEVAFAPIYEGQPRAVDVIAALEARGFCPAGIYRVNRAGYPRRLVDADMVFVRRDLAP